MVAKQSNGVCSSAFFRLFVMQNPTNLLYEMIMRGLFVRFARGFGRGSPILIKWHAVIWML